MAQCIRAWNDGDFCWSSDDPPRCLVWSIPVRGLIVLHDDRVPSHPGVRTEVFTPEGRRLVIEDLDQYLAGLVSDGRWRSI